MKGHGWLFGRNNGGDGDLKKNAWESITYEFVLLAVKPKEVKMWRHRMQMQHKQSWGHLNNKAFIYLPTQTLFK